MSALRTLLVAGGIATLLLALVAASGGGVVPTAALIELFGNDYFLIAAIGGLGLLLAVPVLTSGRAAKLRQLEMPTPERPTSAPPAGSGFDATCRRWRLQVPVYGADDRERLRERLRTAAAEATRRRESCDHDAARSAIDRGSWCDDDVVTAFLAGERLPQRAWIRALSSGDPPFGHAARRTAREIARRDGRG